MNAKQRSFIYWAEIVLGIAAAVLALLGLVSPGGAQSAVAVLGIVSSGVAQLALKNLSPDE